MRDIRTFDFWRDKYGPELLVDVLTLEDMPCFILDATPHRLWFHEILFMLDGVGRVRLDDVHCDMEPGKVLFTAPGQVRTWDLPSPIKAVVLFFTDEFLSETLADAGFVSKLAFFTDGPPSLAIEPGGFESLLRDVWAMKRELPDLRADSPSILQADLYRLLVRLNRLYVEAHGSRPTATCRYVQGFRGLIEEHYAEHMRIAEYAARLGITPGHLNDLCVQQTGMTASDMVQARLLAEARRLLTHSDLTAAQIAAKLGFEDPSYFGRFFKRRAKTSPGRYRAVNP
jgi:AraC family transcriptional regulator, transcriptional activator of pobA